MNEQYPDNPRRTPIPVELSPEHAARVRVRTAEMGKITATAAGIEVEQPVQFPESSNPALITEVPDELKATPRNLHAVPEIITEIPEHLRPR